MVVDFDGWQGDTVDLRMRAVDQITGEPIPEADDAVASFVRLEKPSGAKATVDAPATGGGATLRFVARLDPSVVDERGTWRLQLTLQLPAGQKRSRIRSFEIEQAL